MARDGRTFLQLSTNFGRGGRTTSMIEEHQSAFNSVTPRRLNEIIHLRLLY